MLNCPPCHEPSFPTLRTAFEPSRRSESTLALAANDEDEAAMGVCTRAPLGGPGNRVQRAGRGCAARTPER